MHTFRLLYMALDLAQTAQVKVWRDNREELLAIKHGHFNYEELLQRSEQLMNNIKNAFETSQLPDQINDQEALATLVQVRKTLYH